MRALLLPLLLLPLLSCSPRVVDAPPVTELEPVASSVPDELAPYGAYALVRPGQTLRAKEEPTSALTFVEVSEDSRCPTGVSCVVAGEAAVVVEAGGARRTIRIEANQRSGVRFNVPGGFAEVTALNPYPVYGTKTTPDDYRLKVRIIKAAQQ